jgi:hypothetical protein
MEDSPTPNYVYEMNKRMDAYQYLPMEEMNTIFLLLASCPKNGVRPAG